MSSDADPVFASPATLLTAILNAGRLPEELRWRFGTTSVPGRWFIAAESDPSCEVVVDPRDWPIGGEILPRLLAAAEAEWAAGAPMPGRRLLSEWRRAGGSPVAIPLDQDALQRLLPLLPRLRRRPLPPGDAGRLFALLAQHGIEGVGLPLDLPVTLASEQQVLGDSAPLADALLRLRVLDIEPEAIDRLVAAGWIEPGPGSLRRPGPAARAVLDLLPHDWLRVEVELIPPDLRPVLGTAVLGEAVLAAAPTESRS